MNFWLEDPKGTTVPGGSPKSVTLTLVVISFTLAIVAGILHMLGKVETTSIFLEMFWGCLATYLGRRFNMGGKTYDAPEGEKKDA